MSEVLNQVLALKEKRGTHWRDQDEHYWIARLMQEVGELSSSLVGDHLDSPDHELRQIASIALNWLEMRDQSGASQAWLDKAAKEAEVRSFNNFIDEEYS